MKRVFVVAAVMLLLAGCSGKAEEVNACVERGVEYFKEIGSYPTLSSDPNKGRKAEDVARERCDRTTTAF